MYLDVISFTIWLQRGLARFLSKAVIILLHAGLPGTTILTRETRQRSRTPLGNPGVKGTVPLFPDFYLKVKA